MNTVPLVICILYTVLPARCNISSTSNNTEMNSQDFLRQESTTQSNWGKIKEGFKGIWRDFYTEHFVKKYKKLEDLYAFTKHDLTQKVTDTEEYLAAVTNQQREQIRMLKNKTSEEAVAVLKVMERWEEDVSDFKHKVYSSTIGEVSDLTNQWKESIKNKWNNGLEKLVEKTRELEISANNRSGPPEKRLGLVESLNYNGNTTDLSTNTT